MTRDAAGSPSLSWAFGAILGLFLALALLYNVTTPLFEAPDELQHAEFVAWLADDRGLPVVDSQNPGPWEQEGTQPPLYYWLNAKVLGWLPHDAAGDLAIPNPYSGIGDPQRPDNKNRVLHTPAQERWPYQGTVLLVHLARFLSTLMGAGTLLAIYRLGRSIFPDKPGLALGMMGLVAFIPQFLFLSASINNDNLVILVASWVLVILVRWHQSSRVPGWLALSGLGILLGLGSLAKYSGLLLWPLTGGTMIWLAWRAKRLRWLIPAGLLAFGLAFAVSGWWLLRNQQLYADLSGLGPHLEIMGTRVRTPSVANALREFNGFRYSFWALFGWFNILAPEPFYWLMDGLTFLGIAGFGLFLIRSFRHLSQFTGQAIVLLLCWSGLVAVGVARWTMLTPASQGRLLFPALPAIALVLIAGAAELVPRRIQQPLGTFALAIWIAWATLCPFLFIIPAYALPERVESLEQLSVEPVEIRVRYDDCCELVGYKLAQDTVYPGERVPLTLVWQSLAPVDGEYVLFIHAISADEKIVGQLDTYHGGGMYPVSQWQAGEIIVETVYVPILPRAEGPMMVRFNVGLHGVPDLGRIPVYSTEGEQLVAVLVGEVSLLPFEWPQPQPDSGADAVFEQQIRLAGVELSQAEARPGDVLTATLQWEALERIEQDYVGFVHVVGPSGEDVTQDDHLPLQGRFPTRLWSLGAVVQDPYHLELPSDIEPGTYELWAGFYYPESGLRLVAEKETTGERWKDDLVHVGTLIVSSDTP